MEATKSLGRYGAREGSANYWIDEELAKGVAVDAMEKKYSKEFPSHCSFEDRLKRRIGYLKSKGVNVSIKKNMIKSTPKAIN